MNKIRMRRILAICFIIIVIIIIWPKTPKPNDNPTVVVIENINFVILTPSSTQTNNVTENKNDVVEENSAVPRIKMIMPQKINADFNIMQPCDYTLEELEYAMSGEAYKKMLPYVDTIFEAEEKYGVNALYLLCKLGLESGWGKYRSAQNNIGGWIDIYGQYKDFESVESCILYIANNISTVYVEKVGTRLEDVCERYCPDNGYLEMLMEIMEECEYRINSKESIID